MSANIEELMSEDFLEIVWGESRGWIDLPAKVGRYWVPWHYQYEGEVGDSVSRRIDGTFGGQESLYFSAGMFNKRGRDFDDLKPPQWLWADLDEVHPSEASKHNLLPTLAWESSPGRYQAMWRLEKRIALDDFDRVNQALTYHLGADLGGWDRTQVLRLPGTRNFKYPKAPMVRWLWYHPEVVYSAKYVWSVVKESRPVSGKNVSGNLLPLQPMPTKVKALLRVPADSVVEGERSSKIWAIECGLAEAGWGEDAIYDAVVNSAWNKWSDVATGDRRLRTEIRKAMTKVARRIVATETDAVTGETVSSLSLPFVRYDSFMAMEMEEPRWLIENLWTAGSHGILGGEPKTNKTTLALAIAVAVASGKPFLNDLAYPVRTPGPVMVVQEENAPWMVQDRLKKLAAHSGLIPTREVVFHETSEGGLGKTTAEIDFPADIPLRLLNNWGLDLTIEEHRDALWRECEAVKPRLVILDPLYLLFSGVNFNDAHGLAPFLKWVLALRNEFDCAVILIHHYKKLRGDTPTTRGGQRLMGNATLHGFLDSGLYTEQIEAPSVYDSIPQMRGMYFTRVEREFRAVEPQSALEVGLKLGAPGALDMNSKVGRYDIQAVLEETALKQAARGKITTNQLALILGIDKRVALGRCRDSEVLDVISSRRGMGLSHRVVPKNNNGASAHE